MSVSSNTVEPKYNYEHLLLKVSKNETLTEKEEEFLFNLQKAEFTWIIVAEPESFKYLKNLKEITLIHNVSRPFDQYFANFTTLEKIVIIDQHSDWGISDSSMTDNAFKYIKNNRNLKILHLEMALKLTDDSFRILSESDIFLDELTLDRVEFTNKIFTYSCNSKIRSLKVECCEHITPQGFNHIPIVDYNNIEFY